MNSYTDPSWFPRMVKGVLAVIVLSVAFIWIYEGMPGSAASSGRRERPVDEQRASKHLCRDEVRIIARSDERDVYVLLIFRWDGAEDYYGVLQKGQKFDYSNKPPTPPHYVYGGESGVITTPPICTRGLQ